MCNAAGAFRCIAPRRKPSRCFCASALQPDQLLTSPSHLLSPSALLTSIPATNLQLWRRILERPGDTFVVFHACAGEFPTPEQAGSVFDAVIIGGSHYSVYEDHEWIRRLKALAPQYLEAGATLVGCCFGCQVRLGGCCWVCWE